MPFLELIKYHEYTNKNQYIKFSFQWCTLIFTVDMYEIWYNMK